MSSPFYCPTCNEDISDSFEDEDRAHGRPRPSWRCETCDKLVEDFSYNEEGFHDDAA